MNNTNNLLIDPEVASVKKRKPIFFGLMLLLVAGLISWGVFFFLTYNTSNKVVVEPINPQHVQDGKELGRLYTVESAPQIDKTSSSSSQKGLTDTSTTTDDLSGTLYFSGVTPEQPNAKDYIQLRKIIMGSDVTKPEVMLPQLGFAAVAEYVDKQSQSELFFVGTTSSSVEADGLAIYKYDVKTDKKSSFINLRGDYERNLTWSKSAGLLAFNSFVQGEKKFVNLIPIDNWEVVLFDPTSDTVVDRVEDAFFPHWSPDGSQLVFFKKDGLYTYSLKEKSQRKVVSIPQDGLVTATSMSDLSLDGKYLIWTTAKKGIITVYEISSWDEFAITEVGRHSVPKTEFYWPVISPDSNYYAVQSIDTLEADENYRQNPRIEVRKLLGTKVLKQYPLSTYDFDQLFSDSWLR